MLGLVAVGLLGFALWRLIQAALDPDRHGRSSKGLAIRLAHAVSAATHLALAGAALGLSLGHGAGSEDAAARDWTAAVLAQPFGRSLVVALGAAVAAAGIAMLRKGATASFERKLDLPQDLRRWAVPLSRFGLVARGVVFVMIGGFLALAAWRSDPSEARGLGGALAELQAQPYGWALLLVVALGLFAFGGYCLLEAVFRRIRRA
jgi:hypothetical protein